MKILLPLMVMFLLTAFSSCSSSTNNTSNELKNPEGLAVEKNAKGERDKTQVLTKTSTNDDVVYGEYLIVTVADADIEKVRSILKPLAFNEFKFISHNIIKIKFDKDPGLKELEAKVKGCKDIRSIEANRIVRIPTPVK
jgi:hypothetical protein